MDNVEQIVGQMSEKAVQKCLCELARRLTEKEQEDFLQLLLEYSDAYGKQENNSAIKTRKRKMSQDFVDHNIKLLNDWLENIENGELQLKADGYESYSEDYWNPDWIWEYSDPDNIGGKLTAMLEFAKKCVYDYRYEEALLLYDTILDICVGVENDCDYFEMDLEGLIKEEILCIDLKELALLVLYTDYQVQLPNKRAKDIYTYFRYGYFKNIHVEDMFRMGREQLKGESQFWNDWIEVLSEHNGDMEARLLKEAVLFYKGTEALVDIAEKSYVKHPSLYLSAIQELEKNHDYERIESVADAALDHIGDTLRVRGKVALQAGLAAYYRGDLEKAWEYWYQTYFSDSTVQNYLRLFGWRNCALTYGIKAKGLLKTRQECDKYIQKNEEMQENIIDRETCIYLKFFAGKFDEIKKSCNNTPNSLGWSSSFIKKGVKLFLLYFYQGLDLGKSTLGIAEEFNNEFGFANNVKGFNKLEVIENTKSSNNFWKAFQDWRIYFPIEEAEKKKYLLWLEDLVDKRVKAIVGGKFNNHYGSVAQLASAMGEVKESLGEKGAKQEILLHYKKTFPRHSSFHEALRMQGGIF